MRVIAKGYAGALLALAAVWAPPAQAAGGEAAPVASRSELYAITYRINDDLTHVEEHEYRQRALEASALEGTKHAEITYSAGVQRVEVVEAYTLKADGRRVPVPPGNFQEKANTGHRGNGPVFSDYATLGLVFPEFETGDAAYLHYRIVQTEPVFPGEFGAEGTFFRANASDEVRILIDAPATLALDCDVRQMTQSVVERDGRRLLAFTWQNPVPVRETRRDWSVFDAEAYPGFACSTFENYEAIARAYASRALPKAVVTEQVRRLAADIVKGRKTRRDKAQALYEWVARNITFSGNCVGIGAVVPHDNAFTIGNRMGDCKDHATLLQALLAAQGIPATQALVNASTVYALPRVPLLSTFDHVINYLPEFDLYLDATSPSTPFGYLPDQVAGKPVLLLDGFREGARTPVPDAALNRQVLTSETTFLADGTARGRVEVEQSGLFAIESRARARRMTPAQVDELMHRLYDAEGQPGFGRLTADDAAPLTDRYRFEVQFERPRTINLPGAGGLYFASPYYTNAGILRFIDVDAAVVEGGYVVCRGGRSEETHLIRLPAGTTLFAIPDDLHVADGEYRYDATYRRDGTTVTAHRVIDDRTPGPVCDAGQQRRFRAFSHRVLRDLRAQVVYQLKEDAVAP